ncbi:hypothetical protein TU86_19525 [Pseudomonas weihenstephanensis]|uniref:Uncharacterized protein n=1 Tax=Pseudomonas weihenstephanensis TaxID=1608994 RepID=A0A0J6IIF0_9PSED|nr:hypothetical protein [Pseudomonas weihenstephanensis]KMN12128.1 hypothetical protein TU86_19525 [Pseudomonas weihenstephanensis]
MAHDSEKTRVSEIIKALSDSFVAEGERFFTDIANHISRQEDVLAHGHEACWSDRMQTGGQVECSIPMGIPTKNKTRY